LALAETRLQADTPNAIKLDPAPSGYSIHHVHRSPTASHPLGGGVAVIHRVSLAVSPVSCALSPTSFELQLVRFTSVTSPITAAIIYRPPDTSKSLFVDELSELLFELAAISTDRLLLCGDINTPGPDSVSVDRAVAELLDEHGLVQHVRSPTRLNPDHLLDVLASESSLSVSDVRVKSAQGVSDHQLVVARVAVTAAAAKSPTEHTFRNLRAIDLVDFERRLRNSALFTAPAESTDAFADQLKTVVTGLLDEVAPLRTVRRRAPKPVTRWLSRDAIAAKRARRKFERKWKRTGLEIDRIAYRKACRFANKLITKSRADYYRQQLLSATNCRRRWQIAKQLLHVDQSDCKMSMVTSISCQNFAEFFNNKIVNLKRAVALAASKVQLVTLTGMPFIGTPLVDLPPFDIDTVLKIISSTKPKSSSVDFIPTTLIKSCPDVFAVIICRLANLSFSEGVFPHSFKLAAVTPLLKKPGLDQSLPANYRPISNLNNFSKILERLFLLSFQAHVTGCPAFNSLQSAYRPRHSTETALIHTLDYIYCS